MKSKLLTLLLAIAALAIPAVAQNSGLEFGAAYNYVHTNAPPGGCTCFGMQGGSGWAAFNFNRTIAAVAEVSSQHTSDADGAGNDLTLTSALFGPRVQLRSGSKFSPFAQTLVGVTHASGAFAPGNSGYPGSDNSFGAVVGGGVNVSLNHNFTLRLFEVDYFPTQFNNGVNDHQNNVRFSFGISWHLNRW